MQNRWTIEEDEAVLEGIDTFGNDWKSIRNEYKWLNHRHPLPTAVQYRVRVLLEKQGQNKRADDMANQLKRADNMTDELKRADNMTNQLKRADNMTNQLKRADDMANQLKRADDMANQLKRADDMTNQLKRADSMTNQLKRADNMPKQLNHLNKRVRRGPSSPFACLCGFAFDMYDLFTQGLWCHCGISFQQLVSLVRYPDFITYVFKQNGKVKYVGYTTQFKVRMNGHMARLKQWCGTRSTICWKELQENGVTVHLSYTLDERVLSRFYLPGACTNTLGFPRLWDPNSGTLRQIKSTVAVRKVGLLRSTGILFDRAGHPARSRAWYHTAIGKLITHPVGIIRTDQRASLGFMWPFDLRVWCYADVGACECAIACQLLQYHYRLVLGVTEGTTVADSIKKQRISDRAGIVVALARHDVTGSLAALGTYVKLFGKRNGKEFLQWMASDIDESKMMLAYTNARANHLAKQRS